MNVGPVSSITERRWSASSVTGRRIVAALIDFVFLGALFLFVATDLTDYTRGGGFDVTHDQVTFFFFCLFAMGYFVILEGSMYATIGKLIMGLRVVKVDGDYSDWESIVVRNLLRVVDAVPVPYLLGLVCIATTKNRQRLGDLAAGTVVVRA